MTPEIRESLVQAKPELLTELEREKQLLDMPLSRFAKEGSPIEVVVPWFPHTLWFVPGTSDVEALLREGIERGRICMASELAELMRLPGLAEVKLATLLHVKQRFGATVHSVRGPLGGRQGRG